MKNASKFKLFQYLKIRLFFTLLPCLPLSSSFPCSFPLSVPPCLFLSSPGLCFFKTGFLSVAQASPKLILFLSLRVGHRAPLKAGLFICMYMGGHVCAMHIHTCLHIHVQPQLPSLRTPSALFETVFLTGLEVEYLAKMAGQ